MVVDTIFLAAAIPAVLFAGISKGGFGSGAAFAATPLLALILEPAQAVGLMLPLLMMMDVASLKSYWGKWSKEHALRLALGAIPGVVLGALVFKNISADGLRLMVGLVAVGFVAYQLARSRGHLNTGKTFVAPFWGYFWGAVSGLTSFISHAGGPPSTTYLMGSKLGKTAYQATTVIVFWWINLIKFPFYLGLGMLDRGALSTYPWLVPTALVGVFIGVRAHNMIPETIFFRITYVLLTITGAKLILDALT
ncbi:sulfite exporter TauE/SafE family protein [Amaricoccus tamworthensis]|uniref:sulfite exporter TauE/SafE family protein n=1 Tax=Amaricoccus tamworthensis TaxID=57002 RepID=UPI003C7A31B9